MRLALGRSHFLYIYIFNILFSPVIPALVNVTVDDSGHDPVTNRTITWQVDWRAGQNCNDCPTAIFDNFNPGKTYQRSWHAHETPPVGGLPSFATFSFYGSAIYVFGLLVSNRGPWLAKEADLHLYIDGRLMSTFTQPLPDKLTYNVSFFSINDLTNGEHSLLMLNGEVGGNRSLALIDYLVYSYDPENTTNIGIQASIPQKVAPPPMGPIIGGAIGGALALILLFISVFLCIRRRQQARTLGPRLLPSHSATVTPFSRASSGFDANVKSRLRGTQDVVEPPPYTVDESLIGATMSSRS